MTKRVFTLLVSLFILGFSYAQKSQKFAYIDMEYILENIPEYQEANQQITLKVQKWQAKIAKQQNEIEVLKTNLDNERPLLTAGLIEDREEDIAIRQEELNKTQEMYFGTKGDLYRLRKQFVKPVQDQVYNAIQEISKKQKYDFVMDKSSDLILLYSNNRFDISERVVQSIVRTERQGELKEKRSKKKKEIEAKQNTTKEENPEVVEKMEERANKRKELQARIEAQKAERLRQREEKKKEIEAARQRIIQERQAAKNKTKEKTSEKETIEVKKEEDKAEEIVEEKVEDKAEENKAEEKAEDKVVEKTEEAVEKKVEVVEEIKEVQKTEEEEKAKAQKLEEEKLEAQKAERVNLRAERLKAIEDARKLRLKEREDARKKIEAKRDSIIKARNNPG